MSWSIPARGLRSQTGRDRLGAARATLALAARVAGLRTVHSRWRRPAGRVASAALRQRAGSPVWAVFGRAGTSTNVRTWATSLDASTMPVRSFAGVHFLPEDRHIAKARWNAQLVRAGPVVAGRQGPVPGTLPAPCASRQSPASSMCAASAHRPRRPLGEADRAEGGASR